MTACLFNDELNDELLGRYLDGVASDADLVALQENVVARPEIADALVALARFEMLIHVHLKRADRTRESDVLPTRLSTGSFRDRAASREEPVARTAGQTVPPVIFVTPETSPSRPSFSAAGYFSEGMPLGYLVATVIFALGWLIGSHIYMPNPEETASNSVPSAPAVVKPKMELVGKITGMVDCKWAGIAADSPGVVLGSKYELASGLMEITYNSGAKVVLQGPVTYETESNGGYLAVGKLTGKLGERGEGRGERERKVATSSSPQPLVPSPSSSPQSPIPNPFVIHTPTATVTDLGTEFGVEVTRAGDLEVHVLKGRVDAAFHDNSGRVLESVQLSEGQARRYDAHRAHVTNIPASRAAFNGLRILNASQRHRQWLDYSNYLRKDPALVAYYSFESTGADPRKLPNVAPTGASLDGRIEGPVWSSGRLPGKVGLRFRGTRAGDKVVLPDENRFNFTGPFSVAVWFKVEQFTTWWQTLVAKGDTSWRLHRSEDNDFLGFHFDHKNHEGKRDIAWASALVNVLDGRWHLAVAVYECDGPIDRERLYIDGRLTGTTESPHPLSLNHEPVWIGNNSEKPERGFQGWIDELAIFARALSAQEIKRMFKAGNAMDPWEEAPSGVYQMQGERVGSIGAPRTLSRTEGDVP